MSILNEYEVFFYGKDILIDSISMLIVGFILFTAISYYKIDGKESKKYFMYSFFALTLSFLFRIIGHSLVYYATTSQPHIGLIMLMYQSFFEASTGVFLALTIYKILSLTGFYLLYATYAYKKVSSKHFIILLVSVILFSFASHFNYYLFHAAMFLLAAATTYKVFGRYKKNKNFHTKYIGLSFLLLSLSQAMFMFIGIHTAFYVFGHIIQLLGYGVMLYQFLSVTRYDKKKRAN